MMNEMFNLAVGALAGIVLGGLFFGGLWWTVQKGVPSEQPALWFLGSLILRTAVVLLGLYFVAAGSWQRLLAALLGLIVARFVVMRITRSATG
jgi:F1F0 ATPase subunit 2